MEGIPELGPIDQVSYVVEDLARALPHYTALFGPFRTSEAQLRDCTIRGRRADCRLALALNVSGSVEIELIQVLEGETPHSDHLRAHGEGLHHVRFRVRELDARIAQLEAAGYEPLFYKRFGPGAAFAYLAVPVALGGHCIELLELG